MAFATISRCYQQFDVRVPLTGHRRVSSYATVASTSGRSGDNLNEC